jgi:hypothetical protein
MRKVFILLLMSDYKNSDIPKKTEELINYGL